MTEGQQKQERQRYSPTVGYLRQSLAASLDETHHGGNVTNLLHNRAMDLDAQAEAGRDTSGLPLGADDRITMRAIATELRGLVEVARMLEARENYPQLIEREWGSVYVGDALDDAGDEIPGWRQIGLLLYSWSPDGAMLELRFTDDGAWTLETPGEGTHAESKQD